MTDHDTTATPESTPTADERAGMAWWNTLTEDARRQKLAYLVDLDRAPSPAQAWEIEKRDRAERLLGLARDESAWQAGFVSGHLLRAGSCPNPPNSVEALAWSSGRIEEAARPHDTVPQLRPVPRP